MRKACFAVTIVVLTASATLVAADQIDLRDGKQLLGKIQSESPTEVVIQDATTTHTVPVNRIASVRYDGQPATLTLARTTEDSNDLRRAAQHFARAQTELQNRPRILQAAQFGEARALGRLALEERSGVEEAIARLEKFEQENPESRHHYMAQELLGRLFLESKNYGKATEAFERFSAAPWPEAKLRCATYQAQIWRAQNEFDAALQKVESALQSAASTPGPETALCEAWLEKARCLRELQRRPEEIETLEQALHVAPVSGTSLQAQLYLALGDAQRASGRPKEALFAFLHVELLFAKHKELHAQALYNLSELWNELGQPDRAAAARATLERAHPDSPWTRKLGP